MVTNTLIYSKVAYNFFPLLNIFCQCKRTATSTEKGTVSVMNR
jgi:hypothetical protein